MRESFLTSVYGGRCARSRASREPNFGSHLFVNSKCAFQFECTEVLKVGDSIEFLRFAAHLFTFEGFGAITTLVYGSRYDDAV